MILPMAGPLSLVFIHNCFPLPNFHHSQQATPTEAAEKLTGLDTNPWSLKPDGKSLRPLSSRHLGAEII